jgi:hypothetical protein
MPSRVVWGDVHTGGCAWEICDFAYHTPELSDEIWAERISKENDPRFGSRNIEHHKLGFWSPPDLFGQGEVAVVFDLSDGIVYLAQLVTPNYRDTLDRKVLLSNYREHGIVSRFRVRRRGLHSERESVDQDTPYTYMECMYDCEQDNDVPL